VAPVAEPVEAAVAEPEAPIAETTATQLVAGESVAAEVVAAARDETPEPAVASTAEAAAATAVFEELTEQAVAQAKIGFDLLREMVDGTNAMVADAFGAARAGLAELNARSIDALKENSDAAHAHALDLLAAKTVAEAIELNSSYLRRRFETCSAQAKALQAVAVRQAGEALVPTGEAIERVFGTLRG
jgi:hypothetical protein